MLPSLTPLRLWASQFPSSAPQTPSSFSIVPLAVVYNAHQLGHRHDRDSRSTSASAASPTISLLSGKRLSSATSPPLQLVMPAISTGKVLVSGANGFIATWVVRTLLEQGFAVRGAVHSVKKCRHLCDTFAAYGDKPELAAVPDITQEGAFDEAVKGNPNEIIVPTIKGTLSVLNSAMKHGKYVKRVVLTSSTVAVLQDELEPKTFKALNLSTWEFYKIFTQPSTPAMLQVGNCWVDVRDLAILALVTTSASGPLGMARLAAHAFIVDMAPDSSKYQKGIAGAAKDAVYKIQFNASKSVCLLGMTVYRSKEETARDTIADWEVRGW
ncbi:hypothetical protein DFH08DRAFT_1024006 [Mycena albidolilacea]|uniref:NAD-dependent epimerase/dehydratase domain-containing protein n=1 Tax=Mycena albidolilacea TaxID=1033008 RepID=A0AAD6ZMV4_9AGAR|nr:hypothetical protein DFH08DRAFT_1024006 [Mycena albidolilacea]